MVPAVRRILDQKLGEGGANIVPAGAMFLAVRPGIRGLLRGPPQQPRIDGF